MRALKLDFNEQSASAAGWAVLILSILLVGGMGYSYIRFEEELTVWQKELSKAEAKTGTGSAATQANESNDTGAAMSEARAVVRQLALPWGKLFKAVESSTVEGVSLATVEPDAERNQLIVTGDAKDYAHLLTYVDRLAENPMLSNVHLASHEIKQSDPQYPIGFTVAANWGVAE